MTCVKNKEIDYLVAEHIKARALRIDTALLIKKVDDLKGIINYQDSNLTAYNKITFDQKNVITGYKKDYNDLTIKYQKAEKKASNRAKTTLIFIGTTVLLGTIVLLK